jgi:hypothetical protein
MTPADFCLPAAGAMQSTIVVKSMTAMSPIGTFETSRDVRSLVAIGGKADMALKAHFGSD